MSLWQFMLSTYAKPGMQEQLLRAQDQQGADVLLELTLMWLQEQGQPWPQEVDLSAYEQWRETMIKPLRALRRSLAREQEPLRSQLLAAELSAERAGVKLLEAALLSPEASSDHDHQ